MDAEVVVVGGGIGGLTVAALLAARGVDVCLLERASSVGGCAASFEKFGYSFEQGYGLYTLWQPDEIHQRVFDELPVEPPEVQPLEPSYVVRMPDDSEVVARGESAAFEDNLRSVFPECSDRAIAFYRELDSLASSFRMLTGNSPDVVEALRPRKTLGFLRSSKESKQLLQSSQQTTLDHLQGTSFRFQRFIDVQLQTFAQATSAHVSQLEAALALTASRGRMFGMRGGANALAMRLADSIKRSGGRIRLNTTALRLAYNSAGDAVGVDLLSGETIAASKAIISNLTVWDTYGKLIGLNRLAAPLRQQLNAKRGWGAYLLYLGWDEAAADKSPAEHLLALTNWQEGAEFDPEADQLFFCAAPVWDCRAPEGKRAVTVHTFIYAEDWFTFHTDESDLEAQDQEMLETVWQRLHQAMPELGASVEVIDTATPRSFYEQTRRKLGMAGGVPAGLDFLQRPTYETSIENLFIVSDTTSFGGISGLTYAAAALANKLTGARL